MLINYNHYKLSIIIIINLLLIFKSNSEIIKAAGCSKADINSAILSATDGDIIIVPEDTATWTSALVLTNMPSVTIQGAGPEKTLVIDATPIDGWESSPLWINQSKNDLKPFRITGITFQGVAGVKGMINITGSCNYFRIDNCVFYRDQPTDIGRRGIYVGKDAYGVIDNCTFKHSLIAVVDTDYESWTKPYIFGSIDALFIEKCAFKYTKGDNVYGMISGHSGCRWVLRYCDITYGGLNNHGMCTSPRSGMIMEVYNNTWVCDSKIPHGDPITLRGGTGVIFNNTFTGYKTYPYASLKLTNYRSWYYGCGYPHMGTKCDGTDSCDGNEDSTGYPCMDQIGRAANQVLTPAYEWNNITNGEDMDFIVDSSGLNPVHIIENRDFYNDTKKPDYSPFRYPHPLAYPTILSPDSADTGVAINEILQWYPYLGSVSYGLLISKSPTFSDTVFEKHGLTSQKYKGLILDSLTTYYWKINAKYIKEYISSEDSLVYDSLWSETWNFKTGKNTGIIKNSFKKKDGNLKIIEKFTVYPSIIRKRYSRLAFYCIVKKSTNASIEIFNGKGKVIFRQKISPLVSRGVNTPTVIFTWDLKNTDGRKVSSGIYFPVLKVTDKENGTTETFQSKTSIKVSY